MNTNSAEILLISMLFFSTGGSPYPHTALADLYYVLANGYRMEKPGNCSDEL